MCGALGKRLVTAGSQNSETELTHHPLPELANMKETHSSAGCRSPKFRRQTSHSQHRSTINETRKQTAIPMCTEKFEQSATFSLLLLPGASSQEARTDSAHPPHSTVLEASEQRAVREESSRDHAKSGDQMTDGFKARKMIGLNKSSSSHSDNINRSNTPSIPCFQLHLDSTSRQGNPQSRSLSYGDRHL